MMLLRALLLNRAKRWDECDEDALDGFRNLAQMTPLVLTPTPTPTPFGFPVPGPRPHCTHMPRQENPACPNFPGLQHQILSPPPVKFSCPTANRHESRNLPNQSIVSYLLGFNNGLTYHPPGRSVIENIPKDLLSVVFSKFYDTVELLRSLSNMPSGFALCGWQILNFWVPSGRAYILLNFVTFRPSQLSVYP